MENRMTSKKAVITVLLISLFTHLLAQEHSSYNSKWYSVEYFHNSNTPYSVFSINMNIKNKNVIGEFCYITRYGKRVDCNNKFSSTINNNKIYFDFNSSFGGKNGKAVITFLSNKKIQWKILKNPDGEFYAPRKMILTNKTMKNNIEIKRNYDK